MSLRAFSLLNVEQYPHVSEFIEKIRGLPVEILINSQSSVSYLYFVRHSRVSFRIIFSLLNFEKQTSSFAFVQIYRIKKKFVHRNFNKQAYSYFLFLFRLLLSRIISSCFSLPCSEKQTSSFSFIQIYRPKKKRRVCQNLNSLLTYHLYFVSTLDSFITLTRRYFSPTSVFKSFSKFISCPV